VRRARERRHGLQPHRTSGRNDSGSRTANVAAGNRPGSSCPTTASKCTASVSIREGARSATARPGRRNDNSRMQPIVTERPGVEEEPADPDPPSPDSGDLASRIATVKLPSSRYRPTASRRCLTFSPFQPGEAGVHTVADSGYRWSAFRSGAGGAIATPASRRLSRARKQVNTAHARIRGPGERGNAQLKSWRILRRIRCCPTRATILVNAVQVLILAG
jgi:DDE superfamily endonuclease